MKNIIDSINDFITNEKKNKKNILFWIPFAILFILCLIIFVIYKVSIIGWLLSIILFILTFIFRSKILMFTYTIQIIILCLFIISLSLVFTFTKDTIKIENNNVSKVPLREITFNKTYDLPQGIGTYEIILSTDKEDNRYIMNLNIYADKSLVPSDFIYDTTKAKSYIRENLVIHELDQIEVFITSDDDKVEYYSHGPISLNLDLSGSSALIKELFPTKFTLYFYSEKKLNDFIDTYGKLEVYRYNIGEVGINNFKVEHEADGSYYGSYGYNAEKAYKLHPILLEVPIAWNDLKTKIELN